jgi:tRNA G18 (ribose-2'-O)-methylase SpoU
MRKLRNSELNRLSTEEFKKVEKIPVKVVLNDVRSMHNVGSVFRTCDAFRIEELVLGGITPVPPNPEIEKTALGATQSMVWQHVPELIPYLQTVKSSGYTLIALEQTSSSISILEADNITGNKKALIFGNEVKGVDLEVLKLCDYVVEIPQFGTKHSLNISVSAGIAIWEFAKHPDRVFAPKK